jgi:SAM-dependent methyltransferase
VVDAQVHPTTSLLDLGCGHATLLTAQYERSARVVGTDPDLEALSDNDVLSIKVAASAARLPFRDATFDLVTLAWVFEHLERPEHAFREIRRVLAPGGKVVFLTPNVWNYNVWAIRLIPNALHGFFTERFYGRGEHDTYPTLYRANSAHRLHGLFTTLGFRCERMIFNGDPSYISFNDVLYRVACIIERLLATGPLRRARVHIIGVFRKEASGA